MKNYKVKIPNEKSQFFQELMMNLGFVEFEEVDGFHEPRVYPGADFEIRSRANKPELNEIKGKKKSSTNDGGMQSIRDVLSQIEQQRNKGK